MTKPRPVVIGAGSGLAASMRATSAAHSSRVQKSSIVQSRGFVGSSAIIAIRVVRTLSPGKVWPASFH
jgi:hypothetical protein